MFAWAVVVIVPQAAHVLSDLAGASEYGVQRLTPEQCRGTAIDVINQDDEFNVTLLGNGTRDPNACGFGLLRFLGHPCILGMVKRMATRLTGHATRNLPTGSRAVKGEIVGVTEDGSGAGVIDDFIDAMGGADANQSKAARESGVSQTTISRWVAGDRTPPRPHVRELAESYIRRKTEPGIEARALRIAAQKVERVAAGMRAEAKEVEAEIARLTAEGVSQAGEGAGGRAKAKEKLARLKRAARRGKGGQDGEDNGDDEEEGGRAAGG